MKTKLLALFGLAIGALLLFYWLPEHATRTDAVTADLDHVYYYRAALRLAHGQPLYVGQFLYPPPFAALVVPAALFPFAAFQTIWYTVILLAFWAYAWGLARIAFDRPTVEHVLGAGAILVFVPGTAVTMSFGNLDIVIWALVAWSLTGDGAPAALGACLKVYPAPITLLAIWRNPRALPRHALVFAATWLFALAALGPKPIVEWLRAPMPLPDLVFLWRNVSLSTAVLRVARVTDVHSTFARVTYTGVPLLAIGATLWRTRAWSFRSAGAAVIVATVWSAPVCWWYWLPLGLVPGAAWIRARGVR